MTLLVTGCAGFIGTNFVYQYLQQNTDDKILGLDKLTYAGNLANLDNLPDSTKERFIFVKGDICDRPLVRELFAKYELHSVLNFAAESHVDRSLYNPELFLQTNIIGTHVLMDCAREYWSENCRRSSNRFIQISTDEVYGSLGADGYFTEDSPINPRSPYSASKAAADLVAQSYYETFGFPVIITRSSNNYGPYQFPEKLIPLMIIKCLKHENLPIYGDGKQVRDWIHVRDHCNAIHKVLSDGIPGSTYNIGSNNERTNLEVVSKIIEFTSNHCSDDDINKSQIRFVKDRPGHDRRYAIDPSRIVGELGWQPTIDFEEGLEETVKWYIENQEWVFQVTSGEYQEFYNKHYTEERDFE